MRFGKGESPNLSTWAAPFKGQPEADILTCNRTCESAMSYLANKILIEKLIHTFYLLSFLILLWGPPSTKAAQTLSTMLIGRLWFISIWWLDEGVACRQKLRQCTLADRHVTVLYGPDSIRSLWRRRVVCECDRPPTCRPWPSDLGVYIYSYLQINIGDEPTCIIREKFCID